MDAEIGVNADQVIWWILVSGNPFETHDGPFLELVGQEIQLPRGSKDRPDRDRLALRFEQFKKAA